MSNKMLCWSWGGLYVLCFAMSFFGNVQGTQYGALMVLGLLFFVPGGMLLYRGVTRRNTLICRWIFWLSAGSLALTVLLLILNFLTIKASAVTGLVMHVLLALVSVPMLCTQVWILSWFCWACLLVVSASYLRKHGKE